MHSAFFSEMAEPAPMDHQTSKRSALKHDNYCCVMMGVGQLAPKPSSSHYCHIFPPLTNWPFNPDDLVEKKRKYAGNVWTFIENFRCIDTLSELDGAKIHHLNNTHRVRALDPGVGLLTILPPTRTITFTSTDPHLPLPNPEYLRLHVAVCWVAHFSSAAGYLDLEDWEVERLGVLACDGSSADLLASCLRCVVLMA
ncbi:hypothetical protein AN958_05212 [Leucoagaricus sp. SymC.cos]|nr:hypothetical protein AN958_05212 [Leucoagaricus sp. SymC.cos]